MVDWNKEISFGRKKERDEEPEASEETQSLGPVVLPGPEGEQLPVEPDSQPEPPVEVEPEPVAVPLPVAEDKPEKSSLMKKEISLSFRRKPKEPKLPKVASEDPEHLDEASEKPARKKRSDRTQRGL